MSLSRRRKHHSTQTPAFCITTINSLPFPTSIKVPHLPHRHSLFIPPWRDLEEHSTYESIRVRTARGGRFVLLACDAGSPLKVTLGQDIIAGSNDLGLDSGQRAWDAGLRHFSTVPDFLSSDGYAISIIEHHKRGPRGPGRLRIPHSWISATGDLQWLMVEVVKRLRRGNGRVMITVIRRHREREPDPLGRPRQISVDAYRRLREYEITHPQIVDDEYLDFAIRVAKSSSERLFLGRIAAKNVVETFTFTEQVRVR